MKNYSHFFFAILLCLVTYTGFCQTNNTLIDSNFFKLDRYYALDNNGNWMKYHTAGFYFPESQNHQPSVSLLPNFTFETEKIRFLVDSDELTDPSDYEVVRKIEIPFLYSTVFPNDSQAIGIVSQIKQKRMEQYIPDASRTTGYLPNISRQYKNHPMISQAVNSLYSELDQKRHEQNDYLKIWSAYHVTTTPINAIDVTILVDGREIAKQSIYTNSKEGTYVLQISNPSTQICQDLKNGKFKILLDYRFADPILTEKNTTVAVQKSTKFFVDGERNTDFKADLGIIGAIYNPALFNLDQPCLLLTAIAEKSPLLVAGINSGEVIWKINDRVISSPADINGTLSQCLPGQNITVTLIDLNRNVSTKTVILGKAPICD